ncbi:MAG: glycosyltransferase family 2 protein, partial [Thermoleophilia bacterium]|nr:glycosyltransferase family 2 protein [Thermoleophilia bacterium]
SPTITAAMLVRDRADLLDEAASSVLAQGEDDLELVICDDGSTDGTWEVARELAARDARVVLLRNEDSVGIPAARNQVLAAARGRYLAICDSDDVSLPGRFTRQRALLDLDASIVGVGTRFRAFQGDDPSAGSEPGWNWGLADGRLPFLFPTAMLRVDAVRAVGGFDETYALAEDLDLAYRLASRGGAFEIVDEVLVAYRIHGGSITQRRAFAREWHNLRAQLRGVRLLRGRFSTRGYAVVIQSALRTLLSAVGVRR